MHIDSTFIILLAGDLTIDDRVRALCQSGRIIAADGGIKHATSLGIEPELWLGDFDSTPDALKEQYKHVQTMTFDRQKAMSDGALAVQTALEKGASSIIFLGALGGTRNDHTIAVMHQMMQLHKAGVETMMTSGLEECWPLDVGEFEIELPKGSLFSILPFEDLEGLSISGAEYPLDNIKTEFGSTLTLSNVSQGLTKVSLTKGSALLIARPHDFSGV
ncbi:MAG: thiamine diphosphokinase [Lentilitoribacter sp.]